MYGTRGLRVVAANETRKPIARMSASETVPANVQCSFSNVTQNTLARKSKLVTRLST